MASESRATPLPNTKTWMHRLRVVRTARFVSSVILAAALLTSACTSSDSSSGRFGPGFSIPLDGNEQPSDVSRGKVWFLLDRSGSMAEVQDDVIAGFNRFVSDLNSQPGDCWMTLVLFDDYRPFDVVFSAEPIKNIPRLGSDEYRPRGATPFYDALGLLIRSADSRITDRSAMGELPEDQLVIILTDGLENASLLFSQSEILDLVQDRQGQGWTLAFLGANQDAYVEGAKIGLAGGNVQNFSTSGQSIALAYSSVSRATQDFCGKSTIQRKASVSNFFGGIKEAESGD